jgi:hypothetical protein
MHSFQPDDFLPFEPLLLSYSHSRSTPGSHQSSFFPFRFSDVPDVSFQFDSFPDLEGEVVPGRSEVGSARRERDRPDGTGVGGRKFVNESPFVVVGIWSVEVDLIVVGCRCK